MSSTRTFRGSLAAATLLVLSGAASAAEDLKPAEVGSQLAGEWAGRIQMRADDQQVSVSMASMSAVRNDSTSTLELYYEGFAFGEAIDGAMILSFDQDLPSLMLRDESSEHATLFRVEPEHDAMDHDSLVMASVSAQDGDKDAQASDVRAVFSRADSDAWNIELQQKDADGQWVRTLALQLDRLDQGQHSAASERFARAEPLLALRRDFALASVPTD